MQACWYMGAPKGPRETRRLTRSNFHGMKLQDMRSHNRIYEKKCTTKRNVQILPCLDQRISDTWYKSFNVPMHPSGLRVTSYVVYIIITIKIAYMKIKFHDTHQCKFIYKCTKGNAQSHRWWSLVHPNNIPIDKEITKWPLKRWKENQKTLATRINTSDWLLGVL